MKTGVVQMDCQPGDSDVNMNRVGFFAAKAKAENCDIVVFPEMVDTGYNMDVIQKKAATWEERPYRLIKETAVKNKIYMICNISERTDADQIFNTTLVMDPGGCMIGKYRKNHLADYPPLNEGACITPGNAMEIVQIKNISFGMTICYDLRFCEMNRSLVLRGADVLILSSAWPLSRLRHWNTLIRARAIENQVYVAAANRVGVDKGVTFGGSSCIIDPYGVTLSSAAEEGDTMITGEIDPERIRQIRDKMPVFQHRTGLDKLSDKP
ncbi:MAG: nitrilase-related carbon-nitrogen hydrolase [Thermodesulfobacteriota bacterium]|nr:nitrilase-related carbon-nitrogen hydrolase [Thermodesulfobacteriota bacterium]